MKRIQRLSPRLAPVVVDVQVVPDDMDDLVGILTGNPGHEAPQVGPGPGWTALLDDPSPVHLERAEEGLGPVTDIFEFPPRSMSRAGRTIGEAPFQGLHPRLLIDREDHPSPEAD